MVIVELPRFRIIDGTLPALAWFSLYSIHASGRLFNPTTLGPEGWLIDLTRAPVASVCGAADSVRPLLQPARLAPPWGVFVHPSPDSSRLGVDYCRFLWCSRWRRRRLRIGHTPPISAAWKWREFRKIHIQGNASRRVNRKLLRHNRPFLNSTQTRILIGKTPEFDLVESRLFER